MWESFKFKREIEMSPNSSDGCLSSADLGILKSDQVKKRLKSDQIWRYLATNLITFFSQGQRNENDGNEDRS